VISVLLKQINNNELQESDQKADIKDDLIRMSGADIYIEVKPIELFG
jgi:hypothetical protein